MLSSQEATAAVQGDKEGLVVGTVRGQRTDGSEDVSEALSRWALGLKTQC